MIAVDTSSLIAYLQNDQGKDIKLIIEAVHQRCLVLPPAVLAEILSDPKLPKQLAQQISAIPILDILPGFWFRIAKNRSIILTKKRKARFADAVIAQSCIDCNIGLITRDNDFRHFAKHCDLILAK